MNSLVEIYEDNQIRVFLIRLVEEDDGATLFSIPEKHQKAILNFSLDSLMVTE